MRIEFSPGDAIQLAVIRGLSGERRVEIGAELYEMARQLIADGLRQCSQEMSDSEVAVRTREILAPWYRKALSSR
jgi:hypothetical protein